MSELLVRNGEIAAANPDFAAIVRRRHFDTWLPAAVVVGATIAMF
jgi:hypothetical protein